MQVLSVYLPGGIKEYDENCQSIYAVTRSRFEQDISQINYEPLPLLHSVRWGGWMA